MSVSYADRQSPYYFFNHYYRLLGDDTPLVQFIVHDRTERVAPDNELVGFPAAGITQGPLMVDPTVGRVEDLGNRGIYSDHKTGGFPFFDQLEGSIPRESLDTMQAGYRHMLQLSFPGKDDIRWEGDWPFGSSTFHVFGKPMQNGENWSFVYGWG